MVSKKIVALFAVAAKAQDDSAPTAAEGGRIFSDSLNGVDVSSFLDDLTFGNSPNYVYEDVEADYNGAVSFLSYDGTDGQSDNQTANRPGGDNDTGVKELNLDQVGANASANRVAGYSQCRNCAGLSAAACSVAPLETCNDAQDACEVQIRGTMVSAGNVDVKIWSSCSSRNSCQANADKNFLSTGSGTWRYNHCKSSSLQPRWYHTSSCTICMKLADPSNSNSELFGNDEDASTGGTEIDIDNSGTKITMANIIADPLSHINTDIWAGNDWYTV